ncbi:C39 family peptidase [Dactylosporangium sp. CA-233914]|uniref:C39 family peptidase n=1 Tax=Dactylosporangium sp. CA-233914 TaxID=3239934 RepID=UPI003D8EBA73
MNLVRVLQQARQTVAASRPRTAVISGALLAAAAAAGIVLSQLGDPPPANTASAGAAPAVEQSVAPAPKQSTAPAPAAKVLDYQFQLQPNFYYCGPAATRIALTAAGHTISQDQAATLLHTTTSGTNSAFDTTRALNSVLDRGTVYRTREIPAYPATPAQAAQLRSDVVSAITSGRAVVANIAGHLTDNTGVVHAYEGGHYLTLVGYEDGGSTVKIADPANPRGDGTYWVSIPRLADWISQRGYSY